MAPLDHSTISAPLHAAPAGALDNIPTAPVLSIASVSAKAKAKVPPPPKDAPRVLIIGAGSRGGAYAAALHSQSAAHIVAVAEPRDHVRNSFGDTFIWGKEDRGPGDGESFSDWVDWVEWEKRRSANPTSSAKGIDIAFVCVQDAMHLPVVKALAPFGIHIMCEKPLATTLQDTLDIYAAVRQAWIETGKQTVFGIGHVLRYAPHNELLRKLVREDKVIGNIMSIEHTEPIGWWHYTHSYIRGNWRKYSTSAPSLLTKSCHDIDFILWMMSSPVTGTSEKVHLPSSITSKGSLRYFRNARKPKSAGSATNCLACPIESECHFSAKKIYVEKFLEEEKDTGWPLEIIVPEIEDLYEKHGMEKTKERLLSALKEDYGPEISAEQVAARQWYGRCVYESDNDVCDDQTVTIEWEDDPTQASDDLELGSLGNRGAKTAIFHMVAFTEAVCARRGRIYGELGEITYNSEDIHVTDFKTGKTKAYHIPAPPDAGHGGGDDGLALNMAKAVVAVQKGELDVAEAQWRFLGVDLEEVVRSHAAVFAAEEARTQNKVVDWQEWWNREVVSRMEYLDKLAAEKGKIQSNGHPR